MFLDEKSRGESHEPKKEFIRSSKGYPETRDPMAEKPVGVIAPGAGEGELRSWKNRYAPNSSL